ERTSWRSADGFHALTNFEAANIERVVGDGRAFVIPNPAPQADLRYGCEPKAARFLYLGRIHPVKNVAGLVEAWARARLPDDAELVIAGWGEAADVARLETLVAAAGPSVSFVGPVHGEAKQTLLQGAAMLVLPSFSEAMPMTVLESWAAGVPVIMSHQCNLPEGFAAGAALPCTTDVSSIAEALEAGAALGGSERRAMIRAGLDLVSGAFAPATVATLWAQHYRRLVPLSEFAPQ
ncbi:MAG: glycosyltransferase, partial [Sphingomonadales bacterium]|nr:glycosyltransferase [Sphingomonadales bacterium]